MSFFFSKESKEEIVALFDIGSGSVGGAMVLVYPQNKPVILFSARLPFKIDRNSSLSDNSKNMLKALDQVALMIQKGSHHVPDKVYAILSSPWSRASFKQIKRSHNEPFVLTHQYSKEAINEEIKKFLDEDRVYDEIIDRRTVNVLLNGFSVDRPYGKRAREVQIDLFLSLSVNEITQKIEDVIMKTYRRNIKFTSQMFSDFVVVRDLFEKMDDFILINIDEETTEVSIMNDDFLSGATYFSFGADTMFRSLSEKLNKTPEETKSILKMKSIGHLDDSYDKFLERSIRNTNLEWIELLKSSLRDLISDAHIPQNIYLIADTYSVGLFHELLNKKFFPEFTTTENSFNVIIGDNRVLHDFCGFSEGVKNDSNLTMQAVFINKINFI